MAVLYRYTGTAWEVVGGGGGAPPITLGYAQVTANQTGITSETDLTGLTVTVTVNSGARIRITGHCRAASTANDDVMQLNIKESTTVLALDRIVQNGTGGGLRTIHSEVVLTPSAGSHTYKLSLARDAGTGSVQLSAGATFPAFILVEDITGGTAPSGSSVAHKFKKRTAGSITITADTFGVLDGGGGLDIVLAAATGDSIEVGVGGLFGAENMTAVLDVASMVSGSPVSWWATDGSSSGYGLWYKPTEAISRSFGGSIVRTLVSGDISGGNVTLRLFGRRDSTTNVNVFATSAIPLHFWAKNLGPVAA